MQTAFLSRIGHLVQHALVVVVHNSDGREMIEPWEISEVTSHTDRRSAAGQLCGGFVRHSRVS